MNDEKTQLMDLPMPHPGNSLQEDLPRLRASLTRIDLLLFGLDQLITKVVQTLESVISDSSTAADTTWSSKKINDELSAKLAKKVSTVAGMGLSSNDYTTAEKNKLGNIAPAATKNDSDANLRNRENHTGTQAIATIKGLQVALDGLKARANHTGSQEISTITGLQVALDAMLDEAPKDGKQYARVNGKWTEVKGVDRSPSVKNVGNVATAGSQTITVDVTAAEDVSMSMSSADATGALTIAFANIPATTDSTCIWYVELIRGGRKTVNFNFPAGLTLQWSGGIAPELGKLANSRDQLMFERRLGRNVVIGSMIGSGTV